VLGRPIRSLGSGSLRNARTKQKQHIQDQEIIIAIFQSLTKTKKNKKETSDSARLQPNLHQAIVAGL
jgi:hypothetical protein